VAKATVLSVARGIFLFLIYITYSLSSDSDKEYFSSHLLLNAESFDSCFCSLLLTPVMLQLFASWSKQSPESEVAAAI